jgi:hypothetical protein
MASKRLRNYRRWYKLYWYLLFIIVHIPVAGLVLVLLHDVSIFIASIFSDRPVHGASEEISMMIASRFSSLNPIWSLVILVVFVFVGEYVAFNLKKLLKRYAAMWSFRSIQPCPICRPLI